MSHKAGFVNIVGKPNVGKSTLMNKLVGERLSIITSKAQTTRHRIMGIVNEDDFQIVYSDTPGILDPKYKLHESMMKFVGSALKDADVVLFVTDHHKPGDDQASTIVKLKDSEIPVLLLINKMDLSDQKKVMELCEIWQDLLPKAEIIPISALHGFGTDIIFDRIIEKLPIGPPFFPKDELTDKPMRFFMSEIIREKILQTYQKEIPYSTEVVIEEFKDEAKLVRIMAVIYVARDSQKGIIIGHQGKMLKRVGTEARKDMESFLQKKVFLQMHVKVDKNWRDSEIKLKRFGY